MADGHDSEGNYDWRNDPLEKTPMVRGYTPKKLEVMPQVQCLMCNEPSTVVLCKACYLQAVITRLRRFYHHMINGGHITADDLYHVISDLENIQ